MRACTKSRVASAWCCVLPTIQSTSSLRPQRPVIESAWVSTSLALAGQLRPLRPNHLTRSSTCSVVSWSTRCSKASLSAPLRKRVKALLYPRADRAPDMHRVQGVGCGRRVSGREGGRGGGGGAGEGIPTVSIIITEDGAGVRTARGASEGAGLRLSGGAGGAGICDMLSPLSPARALLRRKRPPETTSAQVRQQQVTAGQPASRPASQPASYIYVGGG
jgi:hypothetical protein